MNMHQYGPSGGRVGPNIITCLHSLSELSALLSSSTRRFDQVMCTTPWKESLAFESFIRSYNQQRLDPRTLKTQLTWMIIPGLEAQQWMSMDTFERDDYEFCKERTLSDVDRKAIDSVVQANDICRNAAKSVSSGRSLVDLLKAKDFAKGELYSYEPTRNYIRATYALGVLGASSFTRED